jgi:tyrosinase
MEVDASRTALSRGKSFLVRLCCESLPSIPKSTGSRALPEHVIDKVSLEYNLGPVSPTMDGLVKSTSPLAYNPRCAKRDLTTSATTKWFTLENLHNLTLGDASENIYTFQNELQGRFTDGFLGLHATGHFAIGGEAGDFYSSTNDPLFFLHHSMLDRVWWIWQALHLDQAETVAGTLTINNSPPSRNTTKEDLIQTNYLNLPKVQIGDVLSTLDGEPLCYIYL